MKLNNLNFTIVTINRAKYLHCLNEAMSIDRYFKLKDVKKILAIKNNEGVDICNYYVDGTEGHISWVFLEGKTLGIGCQCFERKKLVEGLNKLIKDNSNT